MLTENDVIDAVCSHLECEGYEIIEKRRTNERGIDVVAHHKERGRLLIEAKGETSSRDASKRFGKCFNAAQVRVHVASAVYGALCLHDNSNRVAIAFPDTALHRRYLQPLQSISNGLDIQVYLVKSDRGINAL